MTDDLSTKQQQPALPADLVQREPRKVPQLLELVLALVAVALASVLCIWMIFYPATAEPPVAQFFLCIAISLYLSVFFFILWPQPDLEAEVHSWFASKPIKVAGPVVLFFVTLGLLYGLVPPRQKFSSIYPVISPPDHALLFEPIKTEIEYKGLHREDFSYRLISGTDDLDSDQLKEIYIRFPPGEDTIEIVFKHHTFEDYELDLNRGDSAIDLSHMVKTSQDLAVSPSGAQFSGEYLFAGRTLSDFRKELDGAEDQSLKNQLDAGSGLTGIYVKVQPLDDGQVEIELYYSTVLNPKLQSLRAPFRSIDKDFDKLLRVIPK